MYYLSGRVFDGCGFFDGYVGIGRGKVKETGEGRSPEPPAAEGTIVPGLVNCHTHAGDAGLRIDRKMSLEELVAPPDGLKHRYLRETPGDVITSSIKEYSERMFSHGIHHFADFRECGIGGCELLSAAGTRPRPVVLGRPVSKEYNFGEMEDLLDICGGIGISSISDIGLRYAENIAEHVHKRGKILALHASERIREDIDAILSLDPDFVVHMNESSDTDMKKCADRGVPVIVCPRSNLYFGKMPCVARLLDHNVTVGIGTDNAMLCSPDLGSEAAVLTELLRGRPSADDELIDIVLKNGRKILYRGMGIGITTGTDADIAVFPKGDACKWSGAVASII